MTIAVGWDVKHQFKQIYATERQKKVYIHFFRVLKKIKKNMDNQKVLLLPLSIFKKLSRVNKVSISCFKV